MRRIRPYLGTAVRGALALLAAAVAIASTPAAAAAAAGSELWGGPGARGAGNAGARFETTVYVSATSAASGTVEFWSGGAVVATASFNIPARGVATIPAPDALEGTGAFLYHVRSDSPVSAWSETYNDTASGRFGVSAAAIGPTEFLSPGDEGSGGGVEASSSTEPGRSRANAGVLCSTGSTSDCQVEVAAFENGNLLGTAVLTARAGSVAQGSLADLVPAAAEKSGLALRLRVLLGTGLPYVVRNDNRTSDGSFVPLAVTRAAFSTAPVVNYFTGTPVTGCAPLTTTLGWSTTGAVKVDISGVGNDLPPTGTVDVTLSTTTDLVLTATASTGQTTTKPVRITIFPPSTPPTPDPAAVTTTPGSRVVGSLPPGIPANVTIEFVQQESTGSTFVLNGAGFIYTAGSTTGTDVVKLTAQGNCGPVSATFTATVSASAGPQILIFEAVGPGAGGVPAGCYPKSQITLYWLTANTVSVSITNVEFPVPSGNGAQAQTTVEITAPTTFTLTAVGADGKTTSKSVTVAMDSILYTPVISPGSATVMPGDVVQLTLSSVPALADYNQIGWYIVQLPSMGNFRKLSPTQYQYTAGPLPGLDIIRWGYHNGCGVRITEFAATVQQPPPPPAD